jgi:flavoprotein
MRSKIAKRILDETPEDLRIFVRKHSDIVVRVYQLMREKGWTQK